MATRTYDAMEQPEEPAVLGADSHGPPGQGQFLRLPVMNEDANWGRACCFLRSYDR